MVGFRVIFPDKTEREIHDDVLPRIGEELYIYQSGPHVVERVVHQYKPTGHIAGRQVFVSEEKE